MLSPLARRELATVTMDQPFICGAGHAKPVFGCRDCIAIAKGLRPLPADPVATQRENDMSQTSPEAGSRKTGEDLLVGLCGFVTSLVTAFILWWVELAFGFAFYTWMFWFIVPVGALVSGFAGASGYYAGARILNHRPTPLLRLNVLLASVGTFFTIHYLSYITLEIEGKAISDYFSFGQYLDIAIRSMQFRSSATGTGVTGELGGLGYGVAILQLLGFAVGGLAVYESLVSDLYCKRCSRYFSAKGEQIRYTGDGEGLLAFTLQVFSDFDEGAVASAIEKHRTFGKSKVEKGNHLRSVIQVEHCKRCGQHWVRYVVEKQSGDDWRWYAIPELTVAGFTDQVVDV
jgi:hypothetical protein